MSALVQIGIKLLYSGILLGAVYLFANEIYRVWFDRTLVLAPFSYLKDGVESRESGQSFTRRLSHDLQRLQSLYTGSSQTPSEASIPSTDQLGRGRQLDIPITRPNVLPEIEIKAYGIQVTDLLRRMSRAIRRPHEIVGNVSERDSRFDAYAEVRYAKLARGTAAHWHLSGRAGMDELSHDLACRVLLELAAAQAPKLFGRSGSGESVSANEFCGFLLGLDSYGRYRELLSGVEDTGRVEAELKRARSIVDRLLSHGVRLPFNHKLAGYVLNDAGEPASALEQINAYVAMLSVSGHTDESALEFRESLVAETRRELPVAKELGTRGRVRPLRPGISISSESGGAGTLTGLVQDEMGRRYALTAAHVVADDVGSPVIQPAAYDGGSTLDRIGLVSRKLGVGTEHPSEAAAALIELAEDVKAENVLPGRGVIGPPTGAPVELGAKVSVIARSGLKQAEIKAIAVDMQIHVGAGQPTMFRNLILTSPVSEPGDSGAPVVTEDNKLIGFVFAGSQTATLVMPIAPILEALGVKWLDAQPKTDSSDGG